MKIARAITIPASPRTRQKIIETANDASVTPIIVVAALLEIRMPFARNPAHRMRPGGGDTLLTDGSGLKIVSCLVSAVAGQTSIFSAPRGFLQNSLASE